LKTCVANAHFKAMTSAVQNASYTQSEIQIWLRGLLTVAWSDGQFDDTEKAMIHTMVESEFAPGIDFDSLEPIRPEELQALELNQAAAQNFLRMSVMVALADGTYSEAENEQIMAFADVLSLSADVLATLQTTLSKLKAPHALEHTPEGTDESTGESLNENTEVTADSVGVASPLSPPAEHSKGGIDPLKPAREWLDQLSVEDPRLARFVCKLVPSQCPFERDVKVFGHKVVHIPPMCKINPLYEQLVGLRFRALSYLADDVGEDVSAYL